MKVGEAKVGMAVKYFNDAEECWEHDIVEEIKVMNVSLGDDKYSEKIYTNTELCKVYYPHNLVKIDEVNENRFHQNFYDKRRGELNL